MKALKTMNVVQVASARFFLGLVLTLEFGFLPTYSLAQSVPSTLDCSTISEIPQAECRGIGSLLQWHEWLFWKTLTGWLITNTPCTLVGVSCETGHVVQLDLHGNGVRGSIPVALDSLGGLQALDLSSNYLTWGSALPEFGKLANLLVLNLGDNHLSGGIPPELTTLTSLRELDLNRNQIGGTIPPELGQSPTYSA